MGEFVIPNFKAGLDRRLTEMDGSKEQLWVLTNAHITSGGDIEQRRAFSLATGTMTGSFGLEVTDAGLVTFGSGTSPSLPSGVTYQRLQHPSILGEGGFTGSYNSALHDMAAVVFSKTHDGKALVAAMFTDGKTYLYYDGLLVTDSADGLVHSGFSSADWRSYARAVLQDRVINQSGWFSQSTISVLLYANGASSTHSYVFSPETPSGYSFLVDFTSASGVLAGGVVYPTGNAAAAGLAATASFTVAGGGGIFYQVYAPFKDNDGNKEGVTNASYRLNLIVGWSVSNNDTATAIAAAINLRTTWHGYSAAAVGAVVTVSAPIPSTSDWSNLSYTPSFDLNVASADATASGNHAWTAGTKARLAASEGDEFMFAGDWVAGETWSITFTNTASSFLVGKGNLTNRTLTSAIVHRDRAYIASSDRFLYSNVGDVTQWEEHDFGGFVGYNTQFGTNDSVQSFAIYQGKLVVFGKETTQIWQVDADPANFALQQTLQNIGTKAPNSVGTIGELEVLFLANNGVRSLRTREQSLNAYVSDLGSPIDTLIQAALSGLTDAQIAASCHVVEPGSNRYWLFLNESIYVLSYFPISKVVAWSIYAPTYSNAGTQTSFTPQKLVVYNNTIYMRTASQLLSYASTYDTAQVTVETPWHYLGSEVTADSIDLTLQGKWTVQGSFDPYSQSLQTLGVIGNATSPDVRKDATYDKKKLGWMARGTHFKLKLVSDSVNTTKAMLSQIVLRYKNK